MIPSVNYMLRPVKVSDVLHLFERFHGYGGASCTSTYAFAVLESGAPVAAYLWQPPPYGAAKSVCPSAPWGVLSLSRMVAVPKEDRLLNHVSRPLRYQMKHLIDRGRWPCLVTYSDEGQGHTGHVYRCSGWKKTSRSKQAVYVDEEGVRRSCYSNGKMRGSSLIRAGSTWIQRWEHHITQGDVPAWMAARGWVREPIPGKVWRSGKQAHRVVKRGGT